MSSARCSKQLMLNAPIFFGQLVLCCLKLSAAVVNSSMSCVLLATSSPLLHLEGAKSMHQSSTAANLELQCCFCL